METVNAIELANPDVYPEEKVLRETLGDSYGAYCELLELYRRNGLSHEWRYYYDGKAWLCKVQQKKRTIVWMSAWKGFMKATIYFPEKYVEDVYSLDLPTSVIERIKNAKNTGKSKPCTFEIRDNNALGDFDQVMQFKLIAK